MLFLYYFYVTSTFQVASGGRFSEARFRNSLSSMFLALHSSVVFVLLSLLWSSAGPCVFCVVFSAFCCTLLHCHSVVLHSVPFDYSDAVAATGAYQVYEFSLWIFRTLRASLEPRPQKASKTIGVYFYVISRLFLEHFYVISMLFLCSFKVSSMLFLCYFYVTSIIFLCNSMLFLCYFKVISMFFLG